MLDVDCKNGAHGEFDGLAYLGFAILPNTRMAHTASGGLHMYFHPGDHGIRNTAGKKGRGIGAGLDWRGDGGLVILPSPASGYWWDPHYGLDFPLAPFARCELLPREVKREPAKSVERAAGLSPYAEAAVASACRNITHADAELAEDTLHRECFSIGTFVRLRRRRKAGPCACCSRPPPEFVITIPGAHGARASSKARSPPRSTEASLSRAACARDRVMVDSHTNGHRPTGHTNGHRNGTNGQFGAGEFDTDPDETEQLRQQYRESQQDKGPTSPLWEICELDLGLDRGSRSRTANGSWKIGSRAAKQPGFTGCPACSRQPGCCS